MNALASKLRAPLTLMRMFAASGRWWLIPFVLVLVGASLLLAGVQALEYAAPFVYSIF